MLIIDPNRRYYTITYIIYNYYMYVIVSQTSWHFRKTILAMANQKRCTDKSSQNWNSDQTFVDRPPTTRQHLISVNWASFSIILWTLSKIIRNKYLESDLHESWKECFQNFTSTTFFTRSNVYTWIQLYIHTYSTDLNEA